MKGVDIRIDRANTPKEIQIASVDDIWKRKEKDEHLVRITVYIRAVKK